MITDNRLMKGLQVSSSLGNTIGVIGVGRERVLIAYDALHGLFSGDKHK